MEQFSLCKAGRDGEGGKEDSGSQGKARESSSEKRWEAGSAASSGKERTRVGWMRVAGTCG